MTEHYNDDGTIWLSPNYSEQAKMVWSISSDGKTLKMRGYDLQRNNEVYHKLDRTIFDIETTTDGKLLTVSDELNRKIKVLFSTKFGYVDTIYPDGKYVRHSGNIDYSGVLK